MGDAGAEARERETWEQRVERLWAQADLDDAESALAAMRALAAERGLDDPDAQFELGSMHDSTGREQEAGEHYARARALGLAGERLARLDLQEASTLRNLGRVEEAVALLEASPEHPAVGEARAVFLALALRDAGRSDAAIRLLIEALVPHLPRYQRSAAAYARELTEGGPSEG